MNAPLNLKTQLKLRPIDGATGVILPDELLARLGLGPDDSVELSEDAGGFHLAAPAVTFARKMQMLDEIMEEDAEILAALAK